MKGVKIFLPVILALAVSGGGYALYGKLKGPRTAAQSPQGQVVEAKKGNLEVKVNASGSLAMPRKANLTFGSNGIMKELLVDMGDRVTKGQVLARLDTLDLERAALGTEADLKVAEKALKDVQPPYELSPYTIIDIAQAEAAVIAAQAQVKAAEKALQDVRPPYDLSPYTTIDIAQAEAAVIAAQAQVKAAEKALQDVQPPYDLSPYTAADIAQAEATLSAAQAKVKEAENALSKAQGTLIAEDIAHLEAAVADAQKALAIAQQNLTATQTSAARSIADTQETLRQEQEKYKPIIRMPLTGDVIYIDPRILLGVETISDKLETAYQSLLKARDNARLAQEQGAKSLADAEATVAKAEDALKKAQEALARKKSDVPIDLAVRQYQLEDAKASLIKAQEDLKKRKAGPDPLEIATRQAQLESAKVALIKAQEDLKKRKAGPDPLEIATRQAQLESAKVALIKAQEDLKKRKAGPDPLEIASRQLRVRNAQATLDKARDDLGKATIVAPFDGAVASVDGKAGDSVATNAANAANKVVIVMVDTSQMRLEAVLDETSVVRVRVGQETNISLDALPEVTLKGKVTSISPVSTIESGVVNYRTYISVEPQGGGAAAGSARSPQSAPRSGGAPGTGRNETPGQVPQLREGMTALAEIITAQRENVLLVPRQAVSGSGRNLMVKVVVNGKVEERPVRLGMSNEQSVEVREGLAEGEKVLIEPRSARTVNPTASSPGFPQRGFGGLPVGR